MLRTIFWRGVGCGPAHVGGMHGCSDMYGYSGTKMPIVVVMVDRG